MLINKALSQIPFLVLEAHPIPTGFVGCAVLEAKFYHIRIKTEFAKNLFTSEKSISLQGYAYTIQIISALLLQSPLCASIPKSGALKHQ